MPIEFNKIFNTIFKSINQSIENKSDEKIIDSSQPDLPCEFGYKIAWFAIKGSSPLNAIESLKLNILSKCNWQSGIDSAYNKKLIFVSPSLDDFVLVVGVSHDFKINDLLFYSKEFSELQYFASHRVVEQHSWAKIVKNQLVRAYSYIGESGEVLWNECELTKEEIELGFDSFPNLEDNSYDDFPDEESVLNIAAAWGIDPLFRGKKYDSSLGFLCDF